MHQGGVIPKSGLYEMEAGEKVTPATGHCGHWEIDGAKKKFVTDCK
jgi:hypothetical protein